ncbi:putative sugar efflux transporter [Microbacterium sorbitolivorans]|uniref:MFS transporter n=1 Tax=Microbacterium sorbitolivorans TaxID=1867410 RepID=A0A367Y7P6_9MICO|nr:MFS transporter [Microbacterium sorbitolivorans]RCK61875.1 MFS transporter [Microbacterium sorbitolivorans]GGF44946.1 putative sugar efflux transporter [Microbacterium sorbitolivorans]
MTSSLRTVAHDRLYAGATIALLLDGLGASMAAPQIARFLVEDLGVPLGMAGLYYLTNLAAPVAGFLVGRRSDHTGNRLGLFRICAIAGAAGWILIATSTAAWVPFVVSALVLGFAGAAGSQLFAAVHDEIRARGDEKVADGIISIVRMALTAGWVIGPVLGSWLASVTSLSTMLLLTAAACFAQIIPMGFLRDRAPVAAHGDAPNARPGNRRLLPVIAFTGLYVLVYAGEPIKYAYLPIHMDRNLHVSAAIAGAIIGIQPLIELILMPVAVVVARRIGLMRLMVFGAIFGVVANLFFAFSSGPVGLFAGQILMGGVWGIFAGLGIVVAQRLLPEAVATASAIFMSATAIASAIGGATGALGVSLGGLPLVFLAPAAYALLSAIGLVVMSRGRHAVA